jgi:glycerate kinase
MSLNILIAPSGFKEGLEPDEVADCIELGVLRALPDAKIQKVPLVDGGEGFTKALVKITGGTLDTVSVTGPVGRPVEAWFGFLGRPGPKTAVMEMAAAAGLRLVPKELRDPLKTTTYGVGELIKAALDAGAERILIGSADSGTTDGGAGMAQALGVRLLDGSDCEIGFGGGELSRLERIDMSGLDPRVRQVKIDVACNWQTLLCGPTGAARMFGPQKGASPEMVEQLAAATDHYAAVILRETGVDVRTMPGGGSAGGLGTGMHIFLNASLRPRYDVVMEYLEVDKPLREADLVITAEGCLDDTTYRGKIPAEVARRAKPYNHPVIALVGMIGQGAQISFTYGIESCSSILEGPMTLAEAIENAPDLVTRAAERVMRLVLVGQKLMRKQPAGEINVNAQSLSHYPEIASRVVGAHQPFGIPPDFLGTISRELRTPLNLVTGYAGMVKDQVLGGINPTQEKALSQVVTHSHRLLTMINGVMRAAQVERAPAASEATEPFFSDNCVDQGMLENLRPRRSI